MYILRFFLLGLFLAVSAYATSSPKDGKVPDHVKKFLKEAQEDYAKGNLPELMRAYREQRVHNTSLQKASAVSMQFPVLVGKFSDSGAGEPYPVSNLQKQLFDGPWPTGTMTDHYAEMSYGQFDLSGDVLGWYTAPKTKSYYAGESNGLERFDANTGEFIRELILAADDSVDFSQYDNDGDGRLETIFIVHDGEGGECGNNPNIWSHRWRLSAWPTGSITVDGVTIDDYIIQPAWNCDERGMIEIGVFSHEFGHALGLPDLYDRDGSSDGVGTWCLMASGSWGGDNSHPARPSHMNAWCKEQLGWVVPEVLTEHQFNRAVQAGALAEDVIKVWKNAEIAPWTSRYGEDLSVGREYFLIENRTALGFDNYLHGGGGMLIWHVDNSVSSQNDNEEHPLVDLEEADGSMSSRGDGSDPFPGFLGKRLFDHTTFPSSHDYDGINTYVSVSNISDADSIMYADFQFNERIILKLRGSWWEETAGNGNNVPESGETHNIYFSFINSGKGETAGTATLSSGSEDVTVETAEVQLNDLQNGVDLTAAEPFTVSFAPAAMSQIVDFEIVIQAGETVDSLLFSAGLNPDLLLVDDDYGADEEEVTIDVEEYYFDVATANGHVYHHLNLASPAKFDSSFADYFQTVVWFSGSRENTLIDSSMLDALTYFLDNGGHLLLSGQNLLGNHADHPLMSEYARVALKKEDNNNYRINGMEEDIIGQNYPEFYISGKEGADNQSVQNSITLLFGASPIFRYWNPRFDDLYAASRMESSQKQYKMVLFAFGLEAITDRDEPENSANLRRELLHDVMNWFDLPVGIEESEPALQQPRSYSLQHNYPNPFNPSTTIEYNLAQAGFTELTVFDASGRKVATLVSGQQQAGPHKATFNAAQLASGVYYYRLTSGRFEQTQKMLLIK